MPPAPFTLRFHGARYNLPAEARVCLSTPAGTPLLAARISTLTGEAGAEVDRAHMAALHCKIGFAEPARGAHWCVLDADAWRLRWERHTEISTRTAHRPNLKGDTTDFTVIALDLIPPDWLAALPGEILAAAHVALVGASPLNMVFAEGDLIASDVAGGTLRVSADFCPGPYGLGRFIVVQTERGAVAAGRILQQLFEIETYRLLALLTFPQALKSAAVILRLEAAAAGDATLLSEAGGVEAERELLTRLIVHWSRRVAIGRPSAQASLGRMARPRE